MTRTPDAPIESQFLERWSPRAFADRPVSREQLSSLFEAARWAPSCFNDQPWLFLYAVKDADRARVLDLLVPGNRVWAEHAPVLGMVFASNTFAHNGKPNRWGQYDAGAAAMSLALQAHALGLAIHFMGGFDAAASYDALHVREESHTAMAAFALGYRGDPATLPEELREREQPSSRKPLRDVMCEGTFDSPP